MKMPITVVDHPLVQHKLSLMRDEKTPSNVFRQLLREVSLLLGYEVLRDLDMTEVTIKTPLGTMQAPALSGKKLVLVPILRAGLGMMNGVLNLIPTAKVSVVGLYRNEETLEPVRYYVKMTSQMEERIALILDPMLATGGTLVATIDLLKESGCKDIKGIFMVAAPEGIERLQAAHPDVEIWVAAIDEKLNEVGYILPGLGDAGDKIFGTK